MTSNLPDYALFDLADVSKMRQEGSEEGVDVSERANEEENDIDLEDREGEEEDADDEREEELELGDEDEESNDEEEDINEKDQKFKQFTKDVRESGRLKDRGLKNFEKTTHRREADIEKAELLSRMSTLEAKGFPPTRFLGPSDSLQSIRFEVFSQVQRYNDQKSLQWLRKGVVTLATGVEMGNEYFQLFGLKLKGYSSAVKMEVENENYDDCLLELHHKYTSKARKLPPELRLGLLLGGTAVSHHVSNLPASGISNAVKTAVKMTGIGGAAPPTGGMNPPPESDSDSD